MQRTLPAVALACLLATSVQSCRSSPISTYRVTDGVERIEDVGGGKIRGIEIVDDRYERRDGKLYVEVKIRSARGSRAQIESQHEWFDASGFRVGEASNWNPIELGSGEVDTLTFPAPRPEAAILELRLRDREAIN